MPDPVMVLAGVITAALIVYALTGGADYGGGVVGLFARHEPTVPAPAGSGGAGGAASTSKK